MNKTFVDLPEWSFNIDEVSAGVYQVIAIDMDGHRISKTGIDPDVLIEECKKEVTDMNRNDSNAH